MPRPLQGIRVLDVTQVVAGPMASFYLASLGAEVLRIERPGGDLTWKSPPFYGPRGSHRGSRETDEVSLGGMKRNRGKRSAIVSLRHPEGAEIVSALADRSDVLIENFRPGVADRLGLGWEKLSARNQRLVYCSISGYGQSGPDCDLQAMDFTVEAAAGVMAKTGAPDGPPTRVGFPIGDLGPATFAALSVLAALRQRDSTGRGQRIDVSMYDVLVSWLWDDPLDEYEDSGMSPRTGNRELRGAPSNCYACVDGWVNIVVTDDRQWADLVRLLERPDLARHDTNVARVAAGDAVDAAVEDWCRDRTADEIVSRLRSLEIPVAEVVLPWQSRTSPHARAREVLEPLSFREQDGSSTSTDRLGGRFPVHFSDTVVEAGPAEPPGASTDAILRDHLGISDVRIRELRSRGVIGA